MDFSVLASALSPIFASALTYILMRSQRKSENTKTDQEAESLRLRNVESYAQIWKNDSEENRKKMAIILEENKEIKQAMFKLLDLEENCNKQLLAIKKQNVDLSGQILFLTKMKEDKKNE